MPEGVEKIGLFEFPRSQGNIFFLFDQQLSIQMSLIFKKREKFIILKGPNKDGHSNSNTIII